VSSCKSITPRQGQAQAQEISLYELATRGHHNPPLMTGRVDAGIVNSPKRPNGGLPVVAA
jgi:hypothetical protein